jgi:hypothetical protein
MPLAVQTQDVGSRSRSATSCGVGWRGRIRTFDLLIQSQVPAGPPNRRLLSVTEGRIRPLSGVSQAHIPAIVRRIV